MAAEDFGLMSGAEHLPAAVRAFLTGDDAIVHIADFIAFRSAGFADLGTKFVQAM